MTDVRKVKYEVEVPAMLVVEIGKDGEHGNRAATAEDIKRFGYVDPHDAYMRFERWVCDTLGLERDKHITRTVANPTRYAIECALNYPHMPDEDTKLDLRRLQAVHDAMAKVLDRYEWMVQTEEAAGVEHTGAGRLTSAELRDILAPVLAIDAEIARREES